MVLRNYNFPIIAKKKMIADEAYKNPHTFHYKNLL